MENLLEKVAGMLGGLWDWTVHLNGGLQIVLVLLAVVMSGVCAIVAKRMQSKTNNPAAPIMDAAFPYPGRTGTHRDNDRKGTRRTSWEDSSSRRNIP